MIQSTKLRIALVFTITLSACGSDHAILTPPTLSAASAALTTTEKSPTPCGFGQEGSDTASRDVPRGPAVPYGERAPESAKLGLREKDVVSRKRPPLPVKPKWVDSFDAEYERQARALSAKYATDKSRYVRELATLKRTLLASYRASEPEPKAR